METKVEALQDNKVKITVTVDAKEIDNRIKKTYRDFANKYNFPGFRRGKAPRPVIDNALGAEAVRANVTDDVVNESYPLAIDQADLYPVGKPDFDEPALVEGGADYTFSCTVEVKPEIELSSYEPVEIELVADGASDAEIDAQVEGLRDYYHTFEDAAAATKIKEGSYADLSIKATDDNGEAIGSLESESRLYGLGMGLFPETFDAEIMGMKKGQSKSFTIDVPASSESTLMASLAGKTKAVNFEVEVLVVKKQILPELTDEWVKETLGFENIVELRERVADTIKDQKAEALPRMKETACLNALMERVEGEVPAAMCEDAEATLLQDFFTQLQRQGVSFDMYLQQSGLTADQFKADVKLQAADTAKQDLALDAWARHFEYKATDEDVAAEFEKSGTADPKALQEEWRKNGQLHLVRQGILRTRAALEIMDTAKVTEIDPAVEAKKEEKKPAKKAASKKSSAKKDEAAEEKPAAKKTTAKKTAKKEESEA